MLKYKQPTIQVPSSANATNDRLYNSVPFLIPIKHRSTFEQAVEDLIAVRVRGLSHAA